MKTVGIVMGSDSDLPIVRRAVDTLRALDIPLEVHVFSAHRTPEEARVFASSARERGIGVLIAAAGMAAHLAGAVAANTTLPVIGIPLTTKERTFSGMDALLSTIMMPPGIPVATVGVDAAKNAALFAAEILAVTDSDLAARLDAMRKEASEAVLQKNAAVEAEFNH